MRKTFARCVPPGVTRVAARVVLKAQGSENLPEAGPELTKMVA